MTVEHRDNNGGMHLYVNGSMIERLRINLQDLPKDTNVAPLHPTRAPDGMRMEISPVIAVQPYKLNFYPAGILQNPYLATSPIFTLRHFQFSEGLPVESVDLDNTRHLGKLHPMDEGSEYEFDDHPF